MATFTSQPSFVRKLQSRNPALHEPTVQAPPRHSGIPLGTLHTMPQAPQLATLPPRLTSQPLAGLLSQSPNPMAQPSEPHWPATHDGSTLGAAQALPQAPQFLRSLLRSVQRAAQQAAPPG